MGFSSQSSLASEISLLSVVIEWESIILTSLNRRRAVPIQIALRVRFVGSFITTGRSRLSVAIYLGIGLQVEYAMGFLFPLFKLWEQTVPLHAGVRVATIDISLWL
jgi:hypothetical protein